MIALIAICIFSALNAKKILIFLKNTIIVAASFFITFLAIELILSQMTIVTPEEVQQKKVPLTHLVYMGLVGDGSWNADIVGETMSQGNYNDKKAYTVGKIKEKISEYGLLGLLDHITYKESNVMFNKGTLNGDMYINRNPRHERLAHYIWQDNTLINSAIMYYSQSYWRTLLILCICGGFIRIIKYKPNEYMNIAYLIIFGTMLFFSFWESNSRYLVNSSCFIILIASDVMELLTNQLIQYRKRK